jgi:xanthine dehydrogenase accessory factor
VQLVLVKGAGDLASGVAWRLVRCGFAVVMTEVAQPLAVRRTVCFSEAVPLGEQRVEGVTARFAVDTAAALAVLGQGAVPVLVDPLGTCHGVLKPWAVVDARMAKRNLGSGLGEAPVVVGLGPGFTAGVDCHAVVETQRGHWLGRVYDQGGALPDTGRPAERGGHSVDRVVRAPAAGPFRGCMLIGDQAAAGDVLGHIDTGGGGQVPVQAAISGLLRGLIRDGTPVAAGMKLGDVDPTADAASCHTVSDKALAVAGGVLEALLMLGGR